MNKHELCSVSGCSRAVYAKTLCAAHYTKNMREKPDRPRCSVEGCDKTAVTRGWCPDHYSRWRLHGDPTAGRIPRNAAKNFLLNVAVPFESNECLEWPYMKDRTGYGQLQWNGEKQPAHRVVCKIRHGNPLSEDLHAAHNCGNRKCVNPNHLRWATALENAADKHAHGTVHYGADHHNTRISPEIVSQIRMLNGVFSQKRIGQMFGLRVSSVNRILNFKSRTQG